MLIDRMIVLNSRSRVLIWIVRSSLTLDRFILHVSPTFFQMLNDYWRNINLTFSVGCVTVTNLPKKAGNYCVESLIFPMKLLYHEQGFLTDGEYRFIKSTARPEVDPLPYQVFAERSMRSLTYIYEFANHLKPGSKSQVLLPREREFQVRKSISAEIRTC